MEQESELQGQRNQEKGGKHSFNRKKTKDRIAKAFKEDNRKKVRIIPATKNQETRESIKKTRVAAYCRVSTDTEEQASSFQLQVEHYTQYIQKNPAWEFVKVYSDEGISGTSVNHREGFKEMIEDCKTGKIDLVITKSISRFARNVTDCLQYLRMLREKDPPVGVFFEAENMNSLDSAMDLLITVMSAIAQGESQQKSESIKWAFRNRAKQGISTIPTWQLYGYEKDSDGEMFIVEDEAKVVRLIYKRFLDGYTFGAIAQMLNDAGIETKPEGNRWTPGRIEGILRNEKYGGKVLLQKTYTVSFLSHKSKKNTGQLPKYLLEDHHEPIIAKASFDLVQTQIREGRTNIIKKKRAPCFRVIRSNGRLNGFVLLPIVNVPRDFTYDFDKLCALSCLACEKQGGIPQ